MSPGSTEEARWQRMHQVHLAGADALQCLLRMRPHGCSTASNIRGALLVNSLTQSRIHARLRSVVTAAVAVVLTACATDSAEKRDVDQLLLGSSDASSDAVETHLRTLQRDLLRALASTDTSTLGRLLSSHFTVHDTDDTEAVPVSLGSADRPRQMGYLQVLSGALGRRADADYQIFHVTYEGEQATTYAIARLSAVRTTWRLLASGWEATQLILMSAKGARTMIEANQ